MGKNKFKPPEAKGGEHFRTPSTNTAGSTNKLHPTFCLKDLGNFAGCEAEDYSALAKTMRELSQQTWQQLQGRERHKGGFEQITVKQLRGVSLPQDVKDIGYVLAIRYSGMKPMLCSRHEQLLRILHLDRDFTAYNH